MDRTQKVMALQSAGQAFRDASNTLTTIISEHVETLHEHKDGLRGLDSDIRHQLSALHRELSAERQIAEDRHRTIGAKQDSQAERLDRLESKVDQLLAQLRTLSAQLGMNGSGGAHGA